VKSTSRREETFDHLRPKATLLLFPLNCETVQIRTQYITFLSQANFLHWQLLVCSLHSLYHITGIRN
jgi:hypothetical protein